MEVFTHDGKRSKVPIIKTGLKTLRVNGPLHVDQNSVFVDSIRRELRIDFDNNSGTLDSDLLRLK